MQSIQLAPSLRSFVRSLIGSRPEATLKKSITHSLPVSGFRVIITQNFRNNVRVNNLRQTIRLSAEFRRRFLQRWVLERMTWQVKCGFAKDRSFVRTDNVSRRAMQIGPFN